MVQGITDYQRQFSDPHLSAYAAKVTNLIIGALEYQPIIEENVCTFIFETSLSLMVFYKLNLRSEDKLSHIIDHRDHKDIQWLEYLFANHISHTLQLALYKEAKVVLDGLALAPPPPPCHSVSIVCRC